MSGGTPGSSACAPHLPERPDVGPFRLAELAVRDERELPAGVVAARREHYLSDADFERHLGVGKGHYGALPKWKQAQLKKAAGLF